MRNNELPRDLFGSITVRKQEKKFARQYREDGAAHRIAVTIRWDDECQNGHNTFAITADIQRQARNNRWVWSCGGCCHDDVAKRFPKLAKYLKWHLCGADMPMHYVANTVYHASNRDCWGCLKGEPRAVDYYPLTKDGGLAFKVDESGKPIPIKCKTAQEAKAVAESMGSVNVLDHVVLRGEGKERELDAARNSAVWPEATDEELLQEPEALKAALMARLPALMAEFRKDMEELGFVW